MQLQTSSTQPLSAELKKDEEIRTLDAYGFWLKKGFSDRESINRVRMEEMKLFPLLVWA